MSDFQLHELAKQIYDKKAAWLMVNNLKPTHLFFPDSMFMKTIEWYNPATGSTTLSAFHIGLSIWDMPIVFVKDLKEIKVGIMG